jgi:hypothetical protein
LQPYIDYLRANFEWSFIAGAAFLWLLHFLRLSRSIFVVSALLVFFTILIIAILASKPEPISVIKLSSIMLLYGVALFVLIGDLMMWGLARFLTRKRGDKWPKEMDYVYLTIGCFGIVGTLNRLNFVTGHITGADTFAPLFLTTAVVIRFIKTRAEIEGWNKVETDAASNEDTSRPPVG